MKGNRTHNSTQRNSALFSTMMRHLTDTNTKDDNAIKKKPYHIVLKKVLVFKAQQRKFINKTNIFFLSIEITILNSVDAYNNLSQQKIYFLTLSLLTLPEHDTGSKKIFLTYMIYI